MKRFDLEILLEGSEERFDLPAILVDVGDRGGRKAQVIGQENEFLAGGGIAIHDAP